MINIYNRLTEIRKSKKMSVNTLAKLSGVSHTAICNYESGLRSPNIDILTKIASALEVDVNYVIAKTNTLKYENNHIKRIVLLMENIINYSDNDVPYNIIEKLQYILISSILDKREEELNVLSHYIDLIMHLSATLEYTCQDLTKRDLEISKIKYILHDAINEFAKITCSFYESYHSSHDTVESKVNIDSLSLIEDYKVYKFNLLNSKSKVINVDDLSDDEINDIENYISFIRYKKNNGL